MNKIYKKTFDFGKVAYNGKQKRNLVCLDVELKIKNNKPAFSASCDVWQSNMKDIEMGGQCLNDIWGDFEEQIKNPKLFYNILILWRKFHLNDLHAECIHQEQRGENWENNPEAKCSNCGWVLGAGWNYRAIPKPYLCEMMDLLDVPNNERLQIIKGY